MQFTQIIFDLDGTISDPDKGIRNSLQYALQKINIDLDIRKVFSEFIGPPLHDGFQDGLGLNEQQTEQAVLFFREYYGSKGVYENTIYPGITELLKKLKQEGFKVHLATSKLEKYAMKVLELHEILEYFSIISGASYKGKGAGKSFLIQQVLDKYRTVSQEEFLMIGDKSFDILGAKSSGIKSAGVLYGYGTYQELASAGADYLIRTVAELTSFLLKT